MPPSEARDLDAVEHRALIEARWLAGRLFDSPILNGCFERFARWGRSEARLHRRLMPNAAAQDPREMGGMPLAQGRHLDSDTTRVRDATDAARLHARVIHVVVAHVAGDSPHDISERLSIHNR